MYTPKVNVLRGMYANCPLGGGGGLNIGFLGCTSISKSCPGLRHTACCPVGYDILYVMEEDIRVQGVDVINRGILLLTTIAQLKN